MSSKLNKYFQNGIIYVFENSLIVSYNRSTLTILQQTPMDHTKIRLEWTTQNRNNYQSHMMIILNHSENHTNLPFLTSMSCSNLYRYCWLLVISVLSLQLETRWTDLTNFDFEIFVKVQGDLNGEKNK